MKQLCVTATPRSKLQKPRMKLHGAWNFGFSLDLHCIDETNKHDSSCIIEILAQSIQRVSQLNAISLGNKVVFDFAISLHSGFWQVRWNRSQSATAFICRGALIAAQFECVSVCVLLSSLCLVSFDCALQGRQYRQRGEELVCDDLAPRSSFARQIQIGDPEYATEITQPWSYRLEDDGKNDLQITTYLFSAVFPDISCSHSSHSLMFVLCRSALGSAE